MVSIASHCCYLLENAIDCLICCGASSPRSPRASGSSEIHRHVSQVNDSLYLLHKPKGTSPSIQILFFHGLQFGQDYSNAHVSTWENHDGSCIWPQTWLVEEFPKAHMLTVCYTEGLKKRSNGGMDMYNIGENLVSDLLLENIGSSCPVVLVGHSIGGLVIKQLCIQAHDMLHSSSEPQAAKLKAFLKSIKGIFYYSTPHQGSPVANRLKDLFGNSLLMYFASLSTDTQRLNSKFDNISNVHYHWLFAGLGETLSTDLGPFVGDVVPEASARVAANFNLVEGADHFSICRPRSKIVRNFSKLHKFIHGIANDWKEDHENATASKVERLPLPFLKDPKYVVFQTTTIRVQEALESETTGPVVTLCGGPGQGKTSMARYLALYYQTTSMRTESSKVVQNEEFACKDLASSRFVDGVVFLPCGPNMNSKDLLFKLWEILGYQRLPLMGVMHGHASSSTVMEQVFVTESLLSNELTRRLSTQKLLIILDDVWEAALVERLLFPGQWLRYLITTQIPQLWNDARCEQIPLDCPTSQEANQILTNHVYGRPKDITPPLQEAIDSIVEKADRHPLVLANMASNILASIQGKDVDELVEWKNIVEYFDDLIQDDASSSPVVLFNHTYPKTMKASMTLALSSLSEHAQTLLLVASIFDSQPVLVPEVVFKLFFRRLHCTLAKFSRCSKHLQNNNFVQIDSKDLPWSAIPEKTWSLHAMRQTFIEILKGSEVKSMGDMFLECKTEEDILIELLLLYGQEQWRDQAANKLGVPKSMQLGPIKSFVWLLHGDAREEWEEKSHQLAKQILQKYIYCHELDDNSLCALLSTTETTLHTLDALRKFLTWNVPTLVIPRTLHALVNLLELTNNSREHVLLPLTLVLSNLFYQYPHQRIEFTSIPHALDRLLILLAADVDEHVQQWAINALGNLALDGGNRTKIIKFPNVIGRLVTLLAEGTAKNLQSSAAFVLGNLAADVEGRNKIVKYPNVIGRLVALLAEDVGEDVQKWGAYTLAKLAMDEENRIKIIKYPNVFGRLVALLAGDVVKDIQQLAAQALGNLAKDVGNRIKIMEFPNVIGRLVALLIDGTSKELLSCAALALGNLALDIETRIKIVEFPNVIGRLVALLAEDVGEDVQRWGAFTLAKLVADVENRIKIVEFPTVIGRLVALLAEDVGKDAQQWAAQALGNLAMDVENRNKIVECPSVIGRLVALLAEDRDNKVQLFAARALANLASIVENRIKIIEYPNVIGRLVALLAKDVGEDVQQWAACALGNLALDIENRIKIMEFPNVIGRLVALLADDVGKDAQQWGAFMLAHLVVDAENMINIAKFPNVIERLVALLAEDVSKDVQQWAALALGNLAFDVETRMKIVECPNVIERLVALLAEDVGKDVQRWGAFTLAQLLVNAENINKIVKFPNVIGRLVALLDRDVGEDVQQWAALALGTLALDVETRMKILECPNVMGRLVALLAEDVGENVQRLSARALRNLALDIENRIMVIQFPQLIGRLVALFSLDVSDGTRSCVAKTLRILSLEVQSGDYEGALQDYEDTLAGIDPKNGVLLCNRCFVKAKRGDFDGALTDINKFIELGGDRVVGLQERGIVKRMKGDLHGALADLNECLSLHRDDYECLKHRGYIRFLLSDENGARADAERARTAKPGYVDNCGYGSDLLLGTKSVEYLGYNLK